MSKKKSWRMILRTWHYRIGLVAALFLVVLSVSGVMLNHSRFLGLHDVDMNFEFIMWWYGVPEPIFNLERVVIDIHSGKFFGFPGTLFMDLTALATIFLIATGIYTWYKNRK